MGNANKIKQIVSDSSRDYLAKSFEATETMKPYNLADEFGATRKNRSFFVLGITTITVLAFIAAAFILTGSIKRSTEKQSVDISSFEDLNLKDLLDVAKRTEERFSALNREQNDLQRAMDSEIRAVTLEYESDIELIKAKRISDSARRQENAATLRRRDAAIADIRARYAPLLATKQLEVEDAAKALESFDSRMLEQAQKNDELLASERRLFDLEQTKLSAYYEERLATLTRETTLERERFDAAKEALVVTLEKAKMEELEESFLRYNPVFAEPELLERIGSIPVDVARPERAVPGTLLQAGIQASAQAVAIDAYMDSIEKLSARLSLVPYENSVPEALAALRGAAISLSASYAAILELCGVVLQADAEKLRSLESSLSQSRISLAASRREAEAYRSAVEALAHSGGDAGYVLSTDGSTLTLWLDQLAAGAKEAWVFRDDRAIARIGLEREGTLFRGTVIEASGEETPRPFDKIIVTLAVGATSAATSGGTP
ncbi:MAG: hypothetical protein A2Y38_06690 [Spirochaetes bacterium GWB1_59_5]|nr:MAG: hypothetical protein A2Y38_06690 [Spirochaetes bacterium GWB1_59_5]